MSNIIKLLVIGIILLAIVLGVVIFILQEPISNEVSKTVNPWGNCLEKFDILRNTGVASLSGGERMNEYQFGIYEKFSEEHCKYYVFKWMPEHYPERNYVSYGWYHEFRLDLTEEQKQKLQDIGAFPDDFGQFSIKEKTIEPQEEISSKFETAPSSPDNAGALGSEHSHAALLVKIFGDTFDFSSPAYQIKSSWIHFEGRDGTTIHKHATGVDLGYLFETLAIGLDDQCYVFSDGKQFCSNEDYSLKFFINREQVSDIREYEIMEDDRVLIVYGAETPKEIEAYLLQLDNQNIVG